MEIDHTWIERRMSFTRANCRIMREELLQIIYSQPDPENPSERPPGKMTIVEAARTVMMLDLALLKAEIKMGLIKKPVGDIVKEIH